EQEWDGVFGAYAHHGDWVPPNWFFKDLTPEQYLAEAQSWVARGVQIVGGCCGTRPAHIAALRERLTARIPESRRRTRGRHQEPASASAAVSWAHSCSMYLSCWLFQIGTGVPLF